MIENVYGFLCIVLLILLVISCFFECRFPSVNLNLPTLGLFLVTFLLKRVFSVLLLVMGRLGIEVRRSENCWLSLLLWQSALKLGLHRKHCLHFVVYLLDFLRLDGQFTIDFHFQYSADCSKYDLFEPHLVKVH